ncbi:TPA: Metal tolerance protein 1 [Trebouxia sp. C0005]
MTGDAAGPSRSDTEDEDHDLEAQQGFPEILEASIRDPLCRLATNKDGKGVQGKWRLIAAIVLCTLFMIGEVVGGIYAHSLAVLTDAAHMLSDVLAFVISLCAGTYALRASKASHTFGYHRAEVLGSMMSVLIIWVVTGILVYEAVLRIIHPQHVDGKLMFILAITGIAVNLVNLAILGGHHGHSHGGHDHSHGHGHSHAPKKANTARHDDTHAAHDHTHGHHDGHAHKHGSPAKPRRTASHAQDHAHAEHSHDHTDHDHSNTDVAAGHATGQTRTAHAAPGHGQHGHSHMSLGMRGAVIHVLGDCVQSFGVVIAAIIIWVKPEYHIADPICTFIFAIAVICTTRGMVRDIMDIVMERVPRGFDLPGLEKALSKVSGILFISADDVLHVLSRTKNQSSTEEPEVPSALPAVENYKQQQLAVSYTSFVNQVTKQDWQAHELMQH